MNDSDPEVNDSLIVTEPSDREIHTQRTFHASRERVWRAFTEPQLLARWWGRGNEVAIERLEVERGGRWRFVEHAGSVSHGFEGHFREVVQPERIAQTFAWDGLPGHVIIVSTVLEDLGRDRTRVATVSSFQTVEERNGMRDGGMIAGMRESYAALDRLLAEPA